MSSIASAQQCSDCGNYIVDNRDHRAGCSFWYIRPLEATGIAGDEPLDLNMMEERLRTDMIEMSEECDKCGKTYGQHFGMSCPVGGGKFGAVQSASDRKDTNPKDRAATTRLDISVWPETASAYGALAMTEGDYKYGAYNYRIAGVAASVYVSALRRHMAKWYNGEWDDPKTGVPHLANALACIGVLIDAHEAGKLIDDRPPKVDIGRMFSMMEDKVRKLQQVFPPKDGPGRFTEEKHGS